MSITVKAQLQHRSGNLIDLPQLQEAELGFASDAKKVYIGKTVGTAENIELLTTYSNINTAQISNINFSQINGSVGNLNITAGNLVDGEVLAYNSSIGYWVNRGATAGGNINLGAVSNVTVTGGSSGQFLETNGSGVLSWGTPTTQLANLTDTTLSSVANGDVLTYNSTASQWENYPAGNVQTVAGTTYTLQTTDSGTVLYFTSGSSITLTVPTGLTARYGVTVIQGGAGQVTLSAAGGVTLLNADSHTKTASQGAILTILFVAANSAVFQGRTA